MAKRKRSTGNVPVLLVRARTVPEAWEKALLAVWDKGVEVRTEYDSPDDPPSLDATVMVEVQEPMAEPRIHKNFPGGPMELEVYRQEVLFGIHDHWIDPQAGKWTYTYHQRLFAYQAREDLRDPAKPSPFRPVDQIEWMIEKLARAPHSRRAQAVTWIPHADPETDDPPCLQRVWARLLADGKGGFCLNLNTHWRSRDLVLAWFMNVFALTDLQRVLAERLAARLSVPVRCGRYVDVTDSLHIYGKYRDEGLSREVEKMRGSSYRERAWDSSVFDDMIAEARVHLSADPDYYAKGQQ